MSYMPARILLLDEDDALRDLTAAALEDLGYAVVEVESSDAALDLLRRGLRADLLMVDYSPRMNGPELVRQVRAARRKLPIMFLTGHPDAAIVAFAGADGIVLKPFRSEDLARKIRTVLGAGENGKVLALRR